MEQFDTDEKLINNPKGKKNLDINCLLIGICCIIGLFLTLYLFNIHKTSNPKISNSKINESFK